MFNQLLLLLLLNGQTTLAHNCGTASHSTWVSLSLAQRTIVCDASQFCNGQLHFLLLHCRCARVFTATWIVFVNSLAADVYLENFNNKNITGSYCCSVYIILTLFIISLFRLLLMFFLLLFGFVSLHSLTHTIQSEWRVRWHVHIFHAWYGIAIFIHSSIYKIYISMPSMLFRNTYLARDCHVTTCKFQANQCQPNMAGHTSTHSNCITRVSRFVSVICEIWQTICLLLYQQQCVHFLSPAVI